VGLRTRNRSQQGGKHADEEESGEVEGQEKGPGKEEVRREEEEVSSFFLASD
jgi:hypothetical protein